MSARLEIISLAGVSRIFKGDRGEVLALDKVDLSVAEGEFVCIVGPSGCGKSTLMNIIVGLLEPSSGEKRFRGSPSNGLNPEIGYITQSDNLFPWRTVLGNVTFGMEVQGIGKRRARKKRARELLRQVGLEEFAGHYRHELSGGMRQRVNIVRTLACDPKVILMDEPFGPLDAQTRLQLQAMLLELWGQREGITIIFITHDLGEAIALADRVVVMSIRPGRIREIVPVNFPRPRDVFSIHTQPDFRELYDQLWWHLAEEMKGSAG